MKKKLFRVAAASGSIAVLLKGQLRFMNEHYEVTAIASDGYRHKDIQEREGITTIPIRIDRKINLWADFVSLYKLYRTFKKEKPFIVHSLTPKAGLLSMMAAYLAGVPHRMHTFTGLIFPTQTGLMKKVLIFFDKLICFCSTKVYPEGEGVKRDLIHYGITNKPLKVIGNGNVNGIDLTHFDPALFDQKKRAEIRKELKLETSDFVMSFVGRIVCDKGIVEMISSFIEVAKVHTDAKLLLVGPREKQLYPLPASIEQEITDNPHIISVGYQQDVRPFFAITDVFVFPSYREGFPNVVLEAGAMGLPAIVTDINGCNEIIVEGKNGRIIPPKDTNALTHKMLQLYKDKAQLQELARNSRKMITSRFDRQFFWKELLKEYRSLEDSEN